ncbi:MAG: hypothetical protein B7Z39_00330 [Novosphingobium sp. 12-64-8]|nr:MAG: hypothetical protein B7Z39_00330 [Novosphingobium sp. 12-64-8]
MRLALTVLAAILGAVPVQAATRQDMQFPKAPIVLPAGQDAVSTWRDLQIDIEQSEIATSIDSGRVMSNAQGGGLIGALAITAAYGTKPQILRNLKEKAESAIAPIRADLKDVDVDGLAQASVRKGMDRTGWQGADSISVIKVASAEAWRSEPPSAGAAQRTTVFVQYDVSPDFMQVRVLARILVEDRQPGRARILAYLPILSIVQLRDNAFELQRNAEVWAKDNSALARQGLLAAFAQIEHLLPRAFALTESEVALWSAKTTPKVFAAGFNGPMVARTAKGGTVLWENGLVSVETVP